MLATEPSYLDESSTVFRLLIQDVESLIRINSVVTD
jgi:hypothetical protein